MKSDVSYQLVAEMISKLEAKIDERFDKIENSFVTKDKYNAEVGPMREFQSKVIWLIVSSVFLTLLSLVVTHPQVLGK